MDLLKERCMPLDDRAIRNGTRGVRILCLDGGGVRGLIIIEILKEIEKRTKKKIIELFDLIGGTSAGGLIAIGLLIKCKLDVLEIKLKEISKGFDKIANLGPNISRKSAKSLLLLSWGSIYSNDALKNTINSLSEGCHLYEKSKYPKVFVTASLVKGTSNQLYLFNNYSDAHPQENSTSYVTIEDAAIATSAAPGYFARVKIESNDDGTIQEFQDGGLCANNPTHVAIQQASLLWGDRPIHCIISIGTGKYQESPNTSDSIGDLIERLAKGCADSEKVHQLISQDNKFQSSYFRLNPPDLGCIPLDSYEDDILEKLRSDTQQFLKQNDELVDAVAKKLME